MIRKQELVDVTCGFRGVSVCVTNYTQVLACPEARHTACGIYGWSYGGQAGAFTSQPACAISPSLAPGYIAIASMMRSMFDVAVAGAAVTHWEG